MVPDIWYYYSLMRFDQFIIQISEKEPEVDHVNLYIG